MPVYYDQRWKELENALIHQSPSWRHKARFVVQLIEKYIGDNPAVSILDAACGSGFLLYLLSAKYKNLTGLDHSKVALDIAQQNLPDGEFHLLNIEEEALKRKFDLIICANALEEMSNDLAVLRNIRTMLREGGLLVLVTQHSMGYWTQKDTYADNKRRYGIEEIKNKCKAVGLKNLEIFTWGWPIYQIWYPFMVKVNQEKIWRNKRLSSAANFFSMFLYSVLFFDNLFIRFGKGRALISVFQALDSNHG